MTPTIARPAAYLAFALLLAAPALSGCDALEGVFGDGTEISGTVEQVNSDALVVDGTTYAVVPETEFEGFTGLDDVSVGDAVDIEYEDRSGERVALEIEDPSAADPD